MTKTRVAVLVVLGVATIFAALTAYRSYRLWDFYYSQGDLSNAEFHEIELWFKVPLSIGCLTGFLAAATRFLRTK